MIRRNSYLLPFPVSVLALALVFAGSLALAGCGAEPQHEFYGDLVEDPQAAPALTGTNWDGTPFALADLEGDLALIFFGYTFCPDVCPMTLAKMAQVERKLGGAAGEVEMVFVSVDPHRDTVEKMSAYVPAFGDDFHGVHIPAKELGDLTDAWGVTVQYGQPKDGPGTDSFYYVDHTGSYFVIDREGRLRLKFPPNATPDQMVPDLQALISETQDPSETQVPSETQDQETTP